MCRPQAAAAVIVARSAPATVRPRRRRRAPPVRLLRGGRARCRWRAARLPRGWCDLPRVQDGFRGAHRSGGPLERSRQIGTDATLRLVPGSVAVETRQAMTNIRDVLERSGSSVDRAVHCAVVLADLRRWGDERRSRRALPTSPAGALTRDSPTASGSCPAGAPCRAERPPSGAIRPDAAAARPGRPDTGCAAPPSRA